MSDIATWIAIAFVAPFIIYFVVRLISYGITRGIFQAMRDAKRANTPNQGEKNNGEA